MPATVKCDTIKEVNSAVDNLALDSSGNVTIGNNLTVTGTTTQTGSTTFTAQTLFPDGSVSAPSISNTGDVNTGVYFPAADNVAIATGGVAALTADSSQNVAINSATFSPTSPSTGGNLALTGTVAMGSSFLRNVLINGGMQVWQRGTSQSTTGYGSVDRWSNVCAGTTTFSQDTSVPTGVPVQFSLKWVTSAASSYGQSYQAIEQLNVIPLRGQTVTISAYVKTSSYGTGNYLLRAFYSNTTDALASVTTLIGTTAVVGNTLTSWTRLTLTVSIPSDAVGLAVGFLPDTAQASGVTVWHAAVQLEVGSIATPFERRLIGQELALCQRYYETMPSLLVTVSNAGFSNSYTSVLRFAVVKRATPTITYYSASNFAGTVGSMTWYPGSATLVPSTEIALTDCLSYAYYTVSTYNLSGGSIKISAEL